MRTDEMDRPPRRMRHPKKRCGSCGALLSLVPETTERQQQTLLGAQFDTTISTYVCRACGKTSVVVDATARD